MLCRYNTLTWQDVAALDKEKALPILPLSALEQHGCMLPLGTDDFILEAALDRLESEMTENLSKADFFRLPTIHYGCSKEHMAFAGTITLDGRIAAALIENILISLAQHGFKNLVIVNSHGGNTALVEAWAKEWEYQYHMRIFHINFYISDFYMDAQRYLETPLAGDIHAGELETSILKYIYPQYVCESEENWDTEIELKTYYSGWQSKLYAPGNGVMGRPSRATKEKGRLLFDYTWQEIGRRLCAISHFIQEADYGLQS